VTCAAKVGEPAPDFALTCVSAQDEVPRGVRLSDYSGRWLMLIFYPRDFSFVCPTELTSFSARLADFGQRGCELLGVSVDPIELHREWLTTPADEGGLGPLQFPLASDPDGSAARAYGVWVEEKEVSTRGLFVIDPGGVLQYSVVHNLSVGRSPDEVLRVLDALRTGGLCPASWTSADGTIDPEAALRPGRILGHYRIRSKLGGGTFGSVFAARDLRLERLVALKVLRRNVLESREAALGEARAAARLNHPNVCTIYAVEEEDGLPVIAMEYLDGKPLSQVIAEGPPRDRVLNLARQIASGLAAAHAQGVVHGDLKPENVIVTDQGVAKILDFGLARSQTMLRPPNGEPSADAGRGRPPGAAADGSQVGAGEHTIAPDATFEHAGSTARAAGAAAAQPALIRGTPAYMAPEQGLGMPPTPASDVFSLGLLLFEMLTGRRARPGQPSLKLLLELSTTDLAPQLAPQVDDADRDLLSAMVARDAARRPAMIAVLGRLSAQSDPAC